MLYTQIPSLYHFIIHSIKSLSVFNLTAFSEILSCLAMATKYISLETFLIV